MAAAETLRLEEIGVWWERPPAASSLKFQARVSLSGSWDGSIIRNQEPKVKLTLTLGYRDVQRREGGERVSKAFNCPPCPSNGRRRKRRKKKKKEKPEITISKTPRCQW